VRRSATCSATGPPARGSGGEQLTSAILGATVVCVVLLTGVGLSVSELSSPSFVGWTLVLCALIALTGAMPLVKFYSTLTLDGLDELAIVSSLALLAGLVGLLCVQLSLDLLPSLLLVAGACGFPVLLILIGAGVEYHYHHRASSFCSFAVGLLYVYLLALSALTLVVVDFSIGAVVCIASANAGDTSQDLKTGYLLGATPRAQQVALLIGVALGGIIQDRRAQSLTGVPVLVNTSLNVQGEPSVCTPEEAFNAFAYTEMN